MQSILDYCSPAGEQFIIILLKKLSYDEIETIMEYDYYSDNLLLPAPTGFKKNIKTLELPSSTGYVPFGKFMPGLPKVESDNSVTMLYTDFSPMEVKWPLITGDIYGYAICGNKPDAGVMPVIAYEYFGNSNVMKGDDFILSWIEGKINNVMKQYLVKWDE